MAMENGKATMHAANCSTLPSPEPCPASGKAARHSRKPRSTERHRVRTYGLHRLAFSLLLAQRWAMITVIFAVTVTALLADAGEFIRIEFCHEKVRALR